jgi:hypothetical protein
MHRIKLMGLALLAIFAFSAVAAAIANAEEPRLLTLTGAVSSVVYKGKSEKITPKLETEGGKTITCTTASVEAKFSAISKELEKDSEKGTANIEFTGCKQGKVACRSENKAGTEKDAVETILTPLTTLGGDEESTESTLQFFIANKIAPADGSGILFLNCGAVKEEIKGDVPCLVSPALTEIEKGATVTILCQQEKGKGKFGTCKANATTCEELKNNPLVANLGTGKFEGSAEEIHVVGSFNEMVFLDD